MSSLEQPTQKTLDRPVRASEVVLLFLIFVASMIPGGGFVVGTVLAFTVFRDRPRVRLAALVLGAVTLLFTVLAIIGLQRGPTTMVIISG